MKNNGTPRKLNRAVIKEELIALTGHWLSALILNQFLFWSQRTGDVDQFLQEEKRRNPKLEGELTHGWIYKSAKELAAELMTGSSEQTILRHIAPLVQAGYLDQRRNPKYRWDRTWQYRPNICQIQSALHAMGYVLEGYPLQLWPKAETAPRVAEDGPAKNRDRSAQAADRCHASGPAIPQTPIQGKTERTAQESGAAAPDNPAQGRLAAARARMGADPLAVAQQSACARERAGGRIWTAPVEAGGRDAAGERMLAAWFAGKGVDAEVVPERAKARFRASLSQLAGALEALTPQQCARAVEIVLDRNNPEFSYYTYSDPAVQKFKRDWTEVALRLLSGQPGYLTAQDPTARGRAASGRQPTGLAALCQVMEREGVLQGADPHGHS